MRREEMTGEEIYPLRRTLHTVEVDNPERGIHEISVEITWRKLADGYSARLNYGGLGEPGCGADFQVEGVKFMGEVR